MEKVLGLFAKWPISGEVKTRLGEQIGMEAAANLCLAMLEDTLINLAGVSCRKILFFSPLDKREEFFRLTKGAWELSPQSAGDLGQRLMAFFSQYQGRKIAFGSDSPTYPVDWIEQAFLILEKTSAVFGPALDGGCCLIGYQNFQNGFLDKVPWSTEKVLRHLQSNAKLHGINPGLLPPWSDVDTRQDLSLLGDFCKNWRPENQGTLPARTMAILGHLGLLC